MLTQKYRLMITLPVLITSILIISVSTITAYPVRRWVYKEKPGDSNYDFGFSFGQSFSKEIALRISEDMDIQRLIAEFGEAARNPLYYYFISTHDQHFPE